MRIEAYSQVQNVYQSKTLNKSRQTKGAGRTDDLQISTFGKDIQIAKAALAECPDVREELTAPVKAKIHKGTYEVSEEDFAAKLLQKYKEMR